LVVTVADADLPPYDPVIAAWPGERLVMTPNEVRLTTFALLDNQFELNVTSGFEPFRRCATATHGDVWPTKSVPKQLISNPVVAAGSGAIGAPPHVTKLSPPISAPSNAVSRRPAIGQNVKPIRSKAALGRANKSNAVVTVAEW
jgi:hypothetical protein